MTFIAKCLHWGTAILFLGSYVSVYYRHWVTEKQTPESWMELQINLSIGVTIGVVVVLRILWRMMSQAPELEPGTKWEHRCARIGHVGLYVIMIVMPVTGYLGTGVDTEYFFCLISLSLNARGRLVP